MPTHYTFAIQHDAADLATAALRKHRRLSLDGHTVEPGTDGWLLVSTFTGRPMWFATNALRAAATVWASRVGWERVRRVVVV